MRIVVLLAVFGALAPLAEAGQPRRAPAPKTATRPSAPPPVADPVAQAYEQFLRARALKSEDTEGAIAAYRRAMALDPTAADIAADLAELYLEEGRIQEAIPTAEQALKIASGNRTAHRVLGFAYFQLANAGSGRGPRQGGQSTNLSNAILHLEQSIETPPTFGDLQARALLGRLYVQAQRFDKAIAILPDLVRQGWQDGAGLLVEAYAGAGRSADAVKWLEEVAPDSPELYGTLGDFYARERRWADSAGAYEQALANSPRSFDLRIFLASSLLQTGSMPDITKARDVLREAMGIRATDERALYLLAQAERRSGDPRAAEALARKLVAQNARNPRGYFALAEALEEQRQYQAVVDSLAPAVNIFGSANDGGASLGLLLPHLGFAYQQLGQFDKAVQTFENARKIAPGDPTVTVYLIQAQMGAKNYAAAAELARTARTNRPSDLRLARIESLALRRSGKVDQGLAVLEDLARTQADDSAVVVALAQAYADSGRTAQAAKLLRDAQGTFPNDNEIALQLGAVLDKQKQYAESEAVLRQVIQKDPNNAIALNYLGYMLAERGERLNESVEFLKRALAIDPDNGSYLDSIGWAYFKDGKLDLALDSMRRAADQLTTNSVVQDHYGDILFKLGRYDDAIGAWKRALVGDLDSVDKNDIDRKIRSARQKLPKR